MTRGWLPPEGQVQIGLTAGASTPNNLVGEVISTVVRYAGERIPETDAGIPASG